METTVFKKKKFCLAHYYNCPSGWEKYDGFCYLVQREELTWTAARDSCIDRGGNLVSISTEAEAGFIKSFAHYEQVSERLLSVTFQTSF